MTRWALHHGDCLEVMPTLPDKSFDAIIADPPYGTTACKWDSVIPFAPMWEQLKRLIRPRGAIVLFGSQPFTSALVMSNPGMFKYAWVWEKTPRGFVNANVRPLVTTEDIAVFSPASASPSTRIKSVMTYNPQGVVPVRIQKVNGAQDRGKTLHRMGARNQFVSNTPYLQEFTNYPRTILRFVVESAGLHPTQKPVALLSYLVRTYTNPGDTVLDFTAGSGTTGVACLKEGRNVVLIEQDSGYCDVARRRLEEAELQQVLPLEVPV